MRDEMMVSKLKPIALLSLLAGVLIFGAGQLLGNPGMRHAAPHGATPKHDPAKASNDPQTRVLDLAALSDMDGLIDKLAEKRVVFVGEQHDRYDHHLNQLAVIKGLFQRHPDLVIGLEFFQQPFQADLDAYIAGDIDEREFLKRSEYFSRWRYDYRLYRPIIRFAKENGIALIALNVPKELTEKVAKKGFAGLDEADKAQIPQDIDRDDAAYRSRIRQVFDHHPNAEEKNFEHFLDAQLLWDEGMAEQAAEYLRQHPDKRMVLLAGSGHLMYGQGIPKRLQRRLPVDAAIVLNAAQFDMDPALADFLLFPQRIDLPRTGLMGVFLDTEKDGVSIKGFSDDSPAETSGLKKGDRILSIAGVNIESYSDIRLSLMDHAVGEKVDVKVERENLILDDEQLTFSVTLH